MKHFGISILLFFLLQLPIWAQFSISGKVLNEKNEPLAGATVFVEELKTGTITNAEGEFVFENLQPGTYHFHLSFLGYRCLHENVFTITQSNIFHTFRMHADDFMVDEILVETEGNTSKRNSTSLGYEAVSEEFISKNSAGSLMKSIESVAGISAMEIGQGLSKPMIRGLAFNRIAVTDNGIKQEGQQWGADHGLEIDQFGVERLEILKGPASLTVGSDGIGGVINILAPEIPASHTFVSSVLYQLKTVNNAHSVSGMVKYRSHDLHVYARASYNTYSDYRVPADSFFYNRYRLPIYNQTLKNTAGRETDFDVRIGHLGEHLKSTLAFSNVNTVAGFFPGSHGVPNALKLMPDASSSNIELPRQWVNHTKISAHFKYLLYAGYFNLDVGLQQNLRREFSLFHTHFPNQLPPEENKDMELQLKLNTYSADFKYGYISPKWEIYSGINTQLQQNSIGGYMFLIPEFARQTIGFFVQTEYKPAEKHRLMAGVRYDAGFMQIEEFYSPYTQNFKSIDFSGKFTDFTWALGYNFLPSTHWILKTNIGKSFRMPNASELSANGIHHGSFRYEYGNTDIKSEYSYQADMGVMYKKKAWSIDFSPFVNYFPNFIYLNPSGSYLHPEGYEIKEADAGQVYAYTQSEALRLGGELSLMLKPTDVLKVSSVAEYVYATDFEFPIPFTSPFSLHNEVEFEAGNLGKLFTENTFTLSYIYTAAQNRFARNEAQTPAYQLVHFSVSTNFIVSKFRANFVFSIRNVFDVKYFNHLSFYRLIELPEAGRNFQLMIKIPIQQQLH